jgi:DNA-binding HxlR family transcriptional regulator
MTKALLEPAKAGGKPEEKAMGPKGPGDCAPGASAGGGCLTELFQLLSQTHMMGILGVLIWESKGKPVRFVELQTRLGMSPNTLSARLKALVDAGLVTRTPFSTIPPRVDYQATAKAHDLKRVFKALHEWASENTLEPVPAPSAATPTPAAQAPSA